MEKIDPPKNPVQYYNGKPEKHKKTQLEKCIHYSNNSMVVKSQEN